jgi:putative acetyltransferase
VAGILAAMSITIRPETSADSQTIAAVITCAFLDAAHTSHTEHHIVNALRRAGKLAVSLVAEADSVVVGHIAASPVSISDGTSGWFGLGPVSVLPPHQRRGVGSQLMHEALRALRSRGACGCVVLGEPQFYGRFGFQADPDLVLAGVPAQYFQALFLDSSRPKGIVTYHEAFNADA